MAPWLCEVLLNGFVLHFCGKSEGVFIFCVKDTQILQAMSAFQLLSVCVCVDGMGAVLYFNLTNTTWFRTPG